MIKTVSISGYKMNAYYQEEGFVRVEDSNGQIKTMTNAEWARMTEIAELKGAKLT